MISDCPPSPVVVSMSSNVLPSSVLTCHVYFIVPSEEPLATNIALPLLLTVTSVGLDATLANEPDSRKSNTPLPSKSSGSEYV